MKLKTLNDLFMHELRDIYHAEGQLVKALPKMAKAASSPELKAAIQAHLEETKGQVERLERVFEALEHKVKGETCQAMKGLIEEGKELMDEDADPAVLDAGLICAAQKVEHYEISGYGTLITWATQLGLSTVLKDLKANLAEEKAADEKLTKLALKSVNSKARKAETDENEEEDEMAEAGAKA